MWLDGCAGMCAVGTSVRYSVSDCSIVAQLEDVRTGVPIRRYASGSYTNGSIVPVHQRLNIATRLEQIAMAIFGRRHLGHCRWQLWV
jgi:hypothetical protein